MITPTLFLTTEDPYAIYGPGEKIRGTANLDNADPVLPKYIIVSLLAGCRVTSNGAAGAKQTFFHKQFKVPFHNKREDAARELAPGQHKWNFEFTMPAANDLPPSFHYRDGDGSVEVLYCLVLCVYKTNSRPSKENMCTLKIRYSPKRSPSITVNGSLSQRCQPLLVKRYDDEGQARRHKPRIRLPRVVERALRGQRPEQECFHVTIWLPSNAPFTDHMDLYMKVLPGNDDPLRVVEVRLTKVEYRLWATTRVAYNDTLRTRRHQIQSNVFICNTLLELSSYWVSLRRHAPFRIQPKIHGVPLGKDSFSTLGPSFATSNVLREYSLDIDLFLLIYGKTHRVRFENNELILLPHELQLAGD
ncbi:Arrestin domain-containing protein 1 [Exophiala xenobiotica]|uniref:Arrestin domain-containing protein 1 n=1 Tax=Lithohypha guttulata TaxID=1690604 RepID=A0ABR0KHK5_9EURO|nr:Arrestin domain-containing protein 1 [Lithohypha guttulata]KAK5323702.1 Arrestin domain-containing protein 1 [Exophiala xenobiotica]